MPDTTQSQKYVGREEFEATITRLERSVEGAVGRMERSMGDVGKRLDQQISENSKRLDQQITAITSALAQEREARTTALAKEQDARTTKWVPLLGTGAAWASVLLVVFGMAGSALNAKIDGENRAQNELVGAEFRARDKADELVVGYLGEKIGATQSAVKDLDTRLQREMRDLDTGMRGEFAEKIAAVAARVDLNVGRLEALSDRRAGNSATLEAIASTRFTGADAQRMRADLIEMFLKAIREESRARQQQSNAGGSPDLDSAALTYGKDATR